MSCMLPALTSEIAGWIESGLLEIGVLHIATFPKSSPIRRRAFKLSRLGRPFDRARGLVRANLVWLFLARPNLARVAAEPKFRPTSSSTKSQLMLFLLFRRVFSWRDWPYPFGLWSYRFQPLFFPHFASSRRDWPNLVGLRPVAMGWAGQAAQAEERVNPITVADKSHYKILNWRVIE